MQKLDNSDLIDLRCEEEEEMMNISGFQADPDLNTTPRSRLIPKRTAISHSTPKHGSAPQYRELSFIQEEQNPLKIPTQRERSFATSAKATVDQCKAALGWSSTEHDLGKSYFMDGLDEWTEILNAIFQTQLDKLPAITLSVECHYATDMPCILVISTVDLYLFAFMVRDLQNIMTNMDWNSILPPQITVALRSTSITKLMSLPRRSLVKTLIHGLHVKPYLDLQLYLKQQESQEYYSRKNGFSTGNMAHFLHGLDHKPMTKECYRNKYGELPSGFVQTDKIWPAGRQVAAMFKWKPTLEPFQKAYVRNECLTIWGVLFHVFERRMMLDSALRADDEQEVIFASLLMPHLIDGLQEEPEEFLGNLKTPFKKPLETLRSRTTSASTSTSTGTESGFGSMAETTTKSRPPQKHKPVFYFTTSHKDKRPRLESILSPSAVANGACGIPGHGKNCRCLVDSRSTATQTTQPGPLPMEQKSKDGISSAEPVVPRYVPSRVHCEICPFEHNTRKCPVLKYQHILNRKNNNYFTWKSQLCIYPLCQKPNQHSIYKCPFIISTCDKCDFKEGHGASQCTKFSDEEKDSALRKYKKLSLLY